LGLIPATSRADENTEHRRQGSLTLSWGYNRASYTTSNIHFTGPDYDFTLHDIGAVDRPTPFSLGIYISPTRFTLPQYVGRIAYYFSERTSVSLGMAHLKYVAIRGQGTNISGRIGAEASETYAGDYDNDPIALEKSLLLFEHTNGLNYVSLELETLLPLWQKGDHSAGLYATLGGGAGPVVPVTDVTLFGDRRINQTHLAGYGFSSHLGLKTEFLNRFFVHGFWTAGFINLPSILTRSGGGEDRASQHFFFLEGALTGGVTVFRFH